MSESVNYDDIVTAPTTIYDETVDPAYSVDTADAAETMKGLGISDDAIKETTIYIDSGNHLSVNGSVYPKALGRIRFAYHPEIRNDNGRVVRLSTQMQGKPRTREEFDHTLVHELEHIAQMDRGDWRVKAGFLVIYGLAAAGAIAGNKLSMKATDRKAKAAVTIGGALIGQQIGYKIAPHEVQARNRANDHAQS